MSKPAVDHEEITLSEDEQRKAELRLKRKVDFRLIPMLVIIYILNYIDRNNISAARLKGLEQDLGLTDQDYQTSLSILYVGYILMQVPSNLLLHKIGRPSIYLPTCVIIWGTLSALTAVAKNYRDIIVIRFFLGFIEAAFFPGALYVMSRFYTKKEYATRVTLLYAGSILSNAFGGLLAAGM
jgi:MFS family permease